jgi:hypothetical protein
MFGARTLAWRFGANAHNVDFWRSSLDFIRQQIWEDEELVEWLI